MQLLASVKEGNGRNDGGFLEEISEFNSFILDMDLVDVSMSGKKFSWFCSDGISMSILGRLLVSEGLIARCNITCQWTGDRDISDHCLTWLLRSTKDWGPKPFRFNKGWIDHKNFKSFVQTCWAEYEVTFNKAYIVKEKFK